MVDNSSESALTYLVDNSTESGFTHFEELDVQQLIDSIMQIEKENMCLRIRQDVSEIDLSWLQQRLRVVSADNFNLKKKILMSQETLSSTITATVSGENIVLSPDRIELEEISVNDEVTDQIPSLSSFNVEKYSSPCYSPKSNDSVPLLTRAPSKSRLQSESAPYIKLHRQISGIKSSNSNDSSNRMKSIQEMSAFLNSSSDSSDDGNMNENDMNEEVLPVVKKLSHSLSSHISTDQLRNPELFRKSRSIQRALSSFRSPSHGRKITSEINHLKTFLQFFVVGVDFEQLLSDLQQSKLNDYSEKLFPSILSKYPTEETPLVEAISDFCFPTGVSIDIMPEKNANMYINDNYDTTHVMQFTDLFGKPTYACCITIIQKLELNEDNEELFQLIKHRKMRHIAVIKIQRFFRYLIRNPAQLNKYATIKSSTSNLTDGESKPKKDKNGKKKKRTVFKKIGHMWGKFQKMTMYATPATNFDLSASTSFIASSFTTSATNSSASSPSSPPPPSRKDSSAPSVLSLMSSPEASIPRARSPAGTRTFVKSSSDRRSMTILPLSGSISGGTGAGTSPTASHRRQRSRSEDQLTGVSDLPSPRSTSPGSADEREKSLRQRGNRNAIRVQDSQSQLIRSAGRRILESSEDNNNNNSNLDQIFAVTSSMSSASILEDAHVVGSRSLSMEVSEFLITSSNSKETMAKKEGKDEAKRCLDEGPDVIVTQKCYCILSANPSHFNMFEILRAVVERERSGNMSTTGSAKSSADLSSSQKSSPHLSFDKSAQTSTLLPDSHSVLCKRDYSGEDPIRVDNPSFRREVLSTLSSSSGSPSKARSSGPVRRLSATSATEIEGLKRRNDFLRHVQMFCPPDPWAPAHHPSSPYQLHLTPQSQQYTLEDWSCAVLFSVLPIHTVIKLVYILLSESSLIVRGPDIGLTGVIVTALKYLLVPFAWEGIFIPVLPRGSEEMLEAPVPYLVGTVSRPTHPDVLSHSGILHISINYTKVAKIGKKAINISLHTPQSFSEAWSEMSTYNSLLFRLRYLNLKHLSEIIHGADIVIPTAWNANQSIILKSFDSSHLCIPKVMSHITVDIIKIIQKARNMISVHNKEFCGDILVGDSWKKYGESDFYPDKFMTSHFAKVRYQDMVVRTQLFTSYVQKIRTEYIKQESHRNFIKFWILFKVHMKRKRIQRSSKAA